MQNVSYLLPAAALLFAGGLTSSAQDTPTHSIGRPRLVRLVYVDVKNGSLRNRLIWRTWL